MNHFYAVNKTQKHGGPLAFLKKEQTYLYCKIHASAWGKGRPRCMRANDLIRRSIPVRVTCKEGENT